MDETYFMLQTAEDVDRHITDEEIESALGWFPEGERMGTEDFLDRLFPRYGGVSFKGDEFDQVDLDQLANPAAKRLMARARRLRKERDE